MRQAKPREKQQTGVQEEQQLLQKQQAEQQAKEQARPARRSCLVPWYQFFGSSLCCERNVK